MRKAILVLAFFLLMPCILLAGYERPGSTSGQFLKIGVSARAIGMGEAYIAVAEGADAIYYNPAELARITGTDIFATHTRWFASINYEFVGLAHTFNRMGTFGISFASLYTDAMEVRTPLRPDGTGETFYVGNYRAGISYARFLTDRVALGFSAHYLRMDLWNYHVSALIGDLGVFFQTDFHGFRFGMRITNFGPNVKFISESYSLPISFAFGAAIELIRSERNTFTFALTGVKPTDDEQRARVGGEYWFGQFIAVRAGYKFGYDAETWSTGAGIKINLAGATLRIDYAYSDFGLLTSAHRFTLGATF